MNTAPLVRVVVLNFDGGQMTIDCLHSIVATDWPADRLDIVMVDNGSLDDVVGRVAKEFPQVTVIEPLANTGFAGGCNLGINAPGPWDYVALINNDATVEPGWLKALAEAIETDERIGAVNAKIVFADRYQGIDIRHHTVDPTHRVDVSVDGLLLSGVRVDGAQADARLAFDEGFYPEMPVDEDEDPDGDYRRRSRLAAAAVRVSAAEGTSATMSLRLASVAQRRVTMSSGSHTVEVEVGPTPQWIEITLDPEPFDVINNVGSQLFRGGYGGDRGYLEQDRGQYESAADVFAWCGAAVLMKRSYIEQVGVFDERLFLYYEDTDLSWRGQLAGWRYVYVPEAVVRHRHAASSGEGSPVFRFHTERNRFLVNIKLAPASQVLRVLAVEARDVTRLAIRDLLVRAVTLHPPVRANVAERLRIIRSIVRLAPGMVRDRRAMRPVVDRRAILRWEATK
jgi:O-antigen biosynthesis protein